MTVHLQVKIKRRWTRIY